MATPYTTATPIQARVDASQKFEECLSFFFCLRAGIAGTDSQIPRRASLTARPTSEPQNVQATLLYRSLFFVLSIFLIIRSGFLSFDFPLIFG